MICSRCGYEIEDQILIRIKYICLACNKYLRIPAMDRIRMIADKNSFSELFGDIELEGNISPEYSEKLAVMLM